MTNSESNDATEVATKLEQFAAMHRREATFGQWLPAQPWMAISQLEARAAAVIRQQIAREAELAAEIAKLKAEREWPHWRPISEAKEGERVLVAKRVKTGGGEYLWATGTSRHAVWGFGDEPHDRWTHYTPMSALPPLPETSESGGGGDG